MKDLALIARFAALLVVLALFAHDLYAQPAPGSADAPLPLGAAEPGLSLEQAILAALELPHRRPDGSACYARHCRSAVGGCPARARRMALYFMQSATRHGVDAWTLAAIAMHESGGNPNAVGAHGELGLCQLHPRTRHGAMHESGGNPNAVGAHGELGLCQLHPRTRHGAMAARICDTQPRACAAAIIDGAAQLLASAIRRCGDEAHGLSAYNSGSCDRRLVYAERIFARRDRMRGAR